MSPTENASNGRQAVIHGEDGNPHLRRTRFRALVQDFDPTWFSWCMNLGILAILMHQFSYQFPGLQVLATIAFMCDFVLFILFSAILLLRLAWFRAEAYKEMTEDVAGFPLLGCWPIAYLTVVSFVGLTVSQAHWGGHAFTLVAYVMWWIGAVWIVATLLFVFIVLINRGSLADQDVTPTIVIPAVAVATLAVVGGLISSYATDMSARLSVPILIASFCSTGVGFVMAMMLYSFVFHNLLTKGWPPAAQSPTVFMLVGPMGQVSAALQVLSSAASTYQKFGGYHKGTFLTSMAAMPLDVACILLGLLFTGMSAIWLFLAFYVMVYRAVRKELVWTPTWNVIIFPTATLATSCLQFGISLDSPFFKVITGIFIVFLWMVFFTNLAFTVLRIYQGQLLIVRDDPRILKQHEQEQKER